jgi:hypothetical protein
VQLTANISGAYNKITSHLWMYIYMKIYTNTCFPIPGNHAILDMKVSIDPTFPPASPSDDHLRTALSSEQLKRVESGDQVTATHISE